jgi:hypothetical protein
MFCYNCGKELPGGATFCPGCGVPIHGTPGAAPAGTVSGIDTLAKDQKAQQYWVERLLAVIIDYVIVYVILGVIVLLVGIPAFFTAGFGVFGAFLGGLALLWGLVLVLYFAATESSSGASIGKRILGLEVVSKSGGNPTFGEALIRNISKIYFLLLLLDVLVGLAVSRGYTQKYSDHLMQTTVVHS